MPSCLDREAERAREHARCIGHFSGPSLGTFIAVQISVSPVEYLYDFENSMDLFVD